MALGLDERQSEQPTSKDAVRSAGARIAEVESGSVLVATIVLAVAIGILHPEFFAWDQIKDVLAQSVYVGILAAGMAFLLSMREIDLSVGLDVRPHADRVGAADARRDERLARRRDRHPPRRRRWAW